MGILFPYFYCIIMMTRYKPFKIHETVPEDGNYI